MVTWNDLFTQGTLVDYSVHLWRARFQLKPEDFGIESTEEVKKAISFGCHRLAPAESFDEINTTVRKWVKSIEEHSFAFPMLQGVRYVPDTEVAALKAEIEAHQGEFQGQVDAFLASYDTMVSEHLPLIEQALVEAAKTPEAAALAYNRVRAGYPTRDQIAAKFGLEWNFFTISIPQSKEAANAAKEAVPQVQKVVQSIVEQLRGELSEKVANLITLAEKAKAGTSKVKDDIGQRSRESANTVLDKVERMNIFGDRTLSQQIRALRGIVNSDIDLDTVVQDLSGIKANLEADIDAAAKAAEKKLTGLGNRRL